jgi:hypothetical protein
MFFYSRLQASFRSYLSLAALLSAGLIAAQPGLTQQLSTEEGIEDWVAATMCAADNRAVELSLRPSFSFTAGGPHHGRYAKSAAGLGGRFSGYVQFACRAGYSWFNNFLFRHRFGASFCAGHQKRLCQVGLQCRHTAAFFIGLRGNRWLGYTGFW